ncbi:MAG: DUF1737 domain-containing protein [Microcystis sp. M31BS1]|nr:DUF1737 domain-containing protein [Microcystis sp. M31BS1]
MASLVEQVNALVAQGWTLQGGVAVLTEPHFFYQAMIKQELK